MNNSIVGGNTVDDSLVGGNPLNGLPTDIDGTLDPSSSHNLIGPGGSGGLIDGVNGNIVVADAADLLLGPLADNGGPTWTLALLPGSPCAQRRRQRPRGRCQWQPADRRPARLARAS